MPLTEDAMYGKNADGSKNEEYCCYCFENGAFTNPDDTLEEMIESCVPFLVEDENCPEADSADNARSMLQEVLPKLKRWATA